VHEAGRVFAGVALFQAAAHAEIAVAGGEHGLHVLEASRIEGALRHRPRRALQPRADVAQRDTAEAVEPQVTVADPFCRPEPDGPHAGGQRRIDSHFCILDDRAEGRGHAEHLGSLEKDVRSRLAALDDAAICYGIQEAGDAQPLDHRRGVLADRSDPGLDTRAAELSEQLARARQEICRGDSLQERNVVAILATGHLGNLCLGCRASVQDDLQGLAATDPAQSIVDGAVKGQPLLVGETLPCLEVVFGGICDDSVEIEDDGL